MGSIETNAANMEESGQTNNEIVNSYGALPDFSTATTAYCHSPSFPDDTGDEGSLNINCSDRDILYSETGGSNVGIISDSPNDRGGEALMGGFTGAMMIVNSALGAGLLNFPAAFHEAGGIVAANGVQLVSEFQI